MVEMIRRDKRSPNEDMMHVLRMGGIVLLAWLLLWPAVERTIERVFLPDVPITADLTLRWDGDEIKIDYKALPTWPVKAFWVGQLRDGNGAVLLTKRAPVRHSYTPGAQSMKPWSWKGWWEDYSEGDMPVDPRVPDVPFQLCISYDGYGVKSRAPFDTPFQCFDTFSDHLQEAG